MRGRRWLGRIAAVGALGAMVTALALGIGAWRSRGLVDAGAALVSDEEYLPAARALTRAVVAAPRDARAHYFLGLAYAGLGEDEAALRHARDAGRLPPGGPPHQTGLRTPLLHHGRVPGRRAHLFPAAGHGATP